MSGLIDDLIGTIRGSWGTCSVTGILLLSPVFLMPEPLESGNAGLLPFLLSPFVSAVFVPYLCTNGDTSVRTTFFQTTLYSVFVGVVFGAVYLLSGSPRPVAILEGTLVIFSFAVLVSGLYVLIHSFNSAASSAQWFSTIAGLLITGSFIYLSPGADLLYAEREVRGLIIALATSLNPVLAMSGSILHQDLLRGAFLYEHLSIGRYYAYSAPSWIRIVLAYLILGGLLYGLGGWIRMNKQR